MATTPITPTYTFAAATGSIPLSQLDTNFSQLATFLNNPNNFANYLVDSGAANAYAVAFAAGDAPTSYIAGLTLVIKITNANSSASTLNVNSLGVKNITKNGATALAGGELQASSVVVLVYDGTQFQLITSVASPGGSNTQIQFNNSGAFGGSSSLTWDGTTLSANALALTTALPIASGGTNATTAGAALTSLGASPVAGSTSLTTLGTVGTGTWNASLIGGTYGGTGVNNGSNTITVAGNLSHAGAFTQTFTATANTSLSLPASGTLISTVTNMAANPVTGTPSGSNFLRGDGTWAAPSGGSPGGSTTQVQYNSSGAFAGNSGFTFDSTTKSVSLTGNLSSVDTFGYKNRIINGSFNFWQYMGDPSSNTATVTTSASYLGPNRFAFYQGTTANTVVTRSTDVPAGFQYSLKMQRPVSSTNANQVVAMQVLEIADSTDMGPAGQGVNLSFWAKAGANFSGSSSNMTAVVAYQTTSTELTSAQLAAVSGGWSVTSSSIAITTSWVRYSFAVSSATVTSSTTQLGIKLGYTPSGTAGADDSLYITGVQLERGNYTSTYDYRSIGTEQVLCARYLPAFQGTQTQFIGFYYNTGGAITIYVPYIVPTRARGTGVTFIGTWQAYDWSSTFIATKSGSGLASVSPNSAYVTVFTSGTTIAGAPIRVYNGTGSTGLMYISGCEL